MFPSTDLHAHMISRDALGAMRNAFPDLAPELREDASGFFLHYTDRPALGPVPASMFDTQARLADMTGMGVDRQVVAVPPPQLFYHVDPVAGALFARLQNDAAIDVSTEHPDRLHVFATLPLQDSAAAVAEVRRLAEFDCVRGVQIGSNINGMNLDHSSLEPVWQALSESDLPVWVHPDQRAVAGAERLKSYYLINLIGNPLETTIAIASLIFGGVLERFPRLRFGFVHGGGFVPYQSGRWDHGWGCRAESREVIENPPTSYLGRMYFDSLTHDREALEFLGKRVGWQQVVVGSDYPFDMASAQPVTAIKQLGLSLGDEAAVMSENAGHFLRPIG